MLSRSVVSNSLWPHGLWPARHFCPWGFSRQEHWSGALLQGILTALNTGSIPTIVTDFFFKLHYPGFHFGGLKKKKSLMNRILSQLETEGFTLLVSRKWRLGRILFLELKGHLWPRNVWFHERRSSVLSLLIYPRNGEMLKSVTSSDLFPPGALRQPYWPQLKNFRFSGV